MVTRPGTIRINANQTGLRAFQRVQIAAENTLYRGVVVPATHRLVNGMLTVNPEVEYMIPEEQRRSFAERHSVTQTQRRSALSWEGPADFEQVLTWLQMTLRGTEAVPEEANSSRLIQHGSSFYNGYLWNFTPVLGDFNEQYSYTFEFGDNENGFAIPYVMASQIQFSGSMGEAVNLSIEMFGSEYHTLGVVGNGSTGTDFSTGEVWEDPSVIELVDTKLAALNALDVTAALVVADVDMIMTLVESILQLLPRRSIGGTDYGIDDTVTDVTNILGLMAGVTVASEITDFDTVVAAALLAIETIWDVSNPRLATYNITSSDFNTPVYRYYAAVGRTQYAVLDANQTTVLDNTQNAVALNSEFYIDNNWAEVGSTRLVGYLRNWEITLPTGLNPFTTADDNLGYIAHTQNMRTAAVSLSFVSSDPGWQEFNTWREGDSRAIRIVVNGSEIDALGTGVGDTALDAFGIRKALVFDMFIRFDENPEVFTDDEGKSMINFTAHTYDDHQKLPTEYVPVAASTLGTTPATDVDNDELYVVPVPRNLDTGASTRGITFNETGVADFLQDIDTRYPAPHDDNQGHEFRVLAISARGPADPDMVNDRGVPQFRTGQPDGILAG